MAFRPFFVFGDTVNAMIDVATETLLNLNAASRLLPPSRKNKPVNESTLWRWITAGVKLKSGTVLRLEGVRCASRWLTSREALQRFMQRQTECCIPEMKRVRTTRKRKVLRGV
jgi:hypothetical protein